MDHKRTFGNLVMIKLDPENTSIKLRNGFDLYVDTSYEPEKHATVMGIVYGLPSHLQFTGKANKGMPWQTPLEIKMGDKVIFYYLSVINALKPENRRYVIEGSDRYILINYEFIYAIIRDDKITPVNGYVLIEPCEDPSITQERERMKKIGLEMVVLERRTNSHVTYGKVRYIGTPNRRYVDDNYTDDGVDVAVGDTVVMRRTSDIPLQYSLHQKVNEGNPLLRCQRRNLLAKM